MDVVQNKVPGKFVVLVAGTVLLQSLVLLSGLYFRISLPDHRVAMPTKVQPTQVQHTGSARSSRELTGNKVTTKDQFVADQNHAGSAYQQRSATVKPTAQVSTRTENDQSPPVAPDQAQARIVTHTVKYGDTLTKIWSQYGADPRGGLKAAQAFSEVQVPLSAIRVGDDMELQLSPDGDITGLKKQIGNGATLMLDGSSEEGYTASVIAPEVIEIERTAAGTIDRTFADAAMTANVPYAVVDSLVDMFGGRIEFRRDVQPGDSFTVIYTERSAPDGTLLDPGPIKAASFHSRDELLVAVRHVGSDGQERFFDQQGKPIGNFFLRYPVQYSRISSQFSTSRFHPVLKTRRPHNGVDFAAPIGTPVRSVADGVVTFSGYNGGAGRMVKVKHSDRYATAYLHLHSIAKGLKNGARVKRGQEIGKVGKSGLATGPHLHYSFYDNNKYVDPLKIKLPTLSVDYDPIPQPYLVKTLNTLRKSHESIRLAALQRGVAPLG